MCDLGVESEPPSHDPGTWPSRLHECLRHAAKMIVALQKPVFQAAQRPFPSASNLPSRLAMQVAISSLKGVSSAGCHPLFNSEMAPCNSSSRLLSPSRSLVGFCLSLPRAKRAGLGFPANMKSRADSFALPRSLQPCPIWSELHWVCARVNNARSGPAIRSLRMLPL